MLKRTILRAAFVIVLTQSAAAYSDYGRSLANCAALMSMIEKQPGFEEEWRQDPINFDRAADWFLTEIIRYDGYHAGQKMFKEQLQFWSTEPDSKKLRKLLRKQLRGCQWMLDARDQ